MGSFSPLFYTCWRLAPKSRKTRIQPPFFELDDAERRGKAPTMRLWGGSGLEGQRGRGLPFWCKQCQGSQASGVGRANEARGVRGAGKKLGFLGLPKLDWVLGLSGYLGFGLGI
ncbi:hypothetical protein ES288_A11G260000v1 [Gossypium darwinii]|uniref:Uncharacterized protein n=1 Tax=Gossypium darwinii TaxID=34276 RepID=A0A5D2EQ13_GOSDA|nr:hypothetical protein ES288_A11G260000v1 [Gossypium darwinii]